jgi:hypothetical protein
MGIFNNTSISQQQICQFLTETERCVSTLGEFTEYVSISDLQRIRREFTKNVNDFYRDGRKLNIGIIGQVKAGKSTFLNMLLFEGKEILPTARTPKTAALTKIEYSEENSICVEYYSLEEWHILEEYAKSDIEDNEHTVARETMKLVAENSIDPEPYLNIGKEEISFPSVDALMAQLNEYVGENGKFTPMVRSVTLYMNKPELAEISVVDTPGMNDAIASRTDRTREFIGQCDVVFFMSRGSQFMDDNDIKLILSQLPQKGVANLYLICSRFDDALLDELRKCGSLRATIDKIKAKLTEQAQAKFMREDQNNTAAERFLKNCSEPIFISSMVYGMIGKHETEYSRNEAHVFKRLNRFDDLSQDKMQEIGNMGAVSDIFAEVVKAKDATLQEKSKNFVPAVKSEWNAALTNLIAETERKKNLLETGDKETLEKQKKVMESQISSIKASLETILGELRIGLEQAKGDSLKLLREKCRDNARLQERTGTEFHVERYPVTTGILCWKKTHYERSSYTTTYTYLAASDALENIRSFRDESCSQIESAIQKTVDIKIVKRKLLQTILDNFDSSNENFDINHFRLIVESVLNRMEFPVIKLDVDPFIQKVSAQFSGEVKDSGDREKLKVLLSNTMDKLFNDVSEQCEKAVTSLRSSLDVMQNNFSTQLLTEIQEEFDALCVQVEDKEQAIKQYEKVLEMLSGALIT